VFQIPALTGFQGQQYSPLVPPGLTEGMIELTGSIVSTKILNPGDTATVSVEGLGTAMLQVT